MKKILFFLLISLYCFGYNPYSDKYRGDTDLTVAIFYKNEDRVKFLIESGVDINEKTKKGISPLVFALNLGRYNIAEILLEAGATKNLNKLQLEQNYLFESVNYFKTFELLLSLKNSKNNAQFIGELDSTDYRDGKTLLQYTSGTDSHLKVTKLLLEKGADPNDGGSLGILPLEIAIGDRYKFSAPETLKVLIENGARVDIVSNGNIILNRLIMYSSDEFLMNIIKPDISLNIQDYQGFTALMYAARNKRYKIFELLLDYGADFNISALDGTDIFTIAAKDTKVNEILIKRGIARTQKKIIPNQKELEKTSKYGKWARNYSFKNLPRLSLNYGNSEKEKILKFEINSILYHNMTRINGKPIFKGQGIGLGLVYMNSEGFVPYINLIKGKVGMSAFDLRGNLGINKNFEIYAGMKLSMGKSLFEIEVGADTFFKKSGMETTYYTGIGVGF